MTDPSPEHTGPCQFTASRDFHGPLSCCPSTFFNFLNLFFPILFILFFNSFFLFILFFFSSNGLLSFFSFLTSFIESPFSSFTFCFLSGFSLFLDASPSNLAILAFLGPSDFFVSDFTPAFFVIMGCSDFVCFNLCFLPMLLFSGVEAGFCCLDSGFWICFVEAAGLSFCRFYFLFWRWVNIINIRSENKQDVETRGVRYIYIYSLR